MYSVVLLKAGCTAELAMLSACGERAAEHKFSDAGQGEGRVAHDAKRSDPILVDSTSCQQPSEGTSSNDVQGSINIPRRCTEFDQAFLSLCSHAINNQFVSEK